jgi:hypothetical protein
LYYTISNVPIGPLHVEEFNVSLITMPVTIVPAGFIVLRCAFEFLTVNPMRFCGNQGPNGTLVPPEDREILWAAYRPGPPTTTNAGWKICWPPSPPPSPPPTPPSPPSPPPLPSELTVGAEVCLVVKPDGPLDLDKVQLGIAQVFGFFEGLVHDVEAVPRCTYTMDR